jgi:hypothetical protein
VEWFDVHDTVIIATYVLLNTIYPTYGYGMKGVFVFTGFFSGSSQRANPVKWNEGVRATGGEHTSRFVS